MAAKYDPTGILTPIGAGSGGITQARGTGLLQDRRACAIEVAGPIVRWRQAAHAIATADEQRQREGVQGRHA